MQLAKTREGRRTRGEKRYNPSIGVMHITDTLDPGGAERVAVNIANHLPRERFQTYLCATRREGALASLIAPHTGLVCLHRKSRLDGQALCHLMAFNHSHEIRILHAHGTSLFIAVLASLARPHPAVVWHDHWGRCDVQDRPAWLYRLFARRLRGVIAVNDTLAKWSHERLRVPASRVWYVPNFAVESESRGASPRLPGREGARIVCVANLRPQKDHLTLLKAMRRVVDFVPDSHLLLVGQYSDHGYAKEVQGAIPAFGLDPNVTLLGLRHDVPAILRVCDIGVLSSSSEGLPLALIEYGLAGLPSVATRVGQCAEVLDGGRVGMLVPPAAPDLLADALLRLLMSPPQRACLGERFRQRVEKVYSPCAVIARVCEVYDTVLGVGPELQCTR